MSRAPELPLLRHQTSLAPAEWLRASLTTFAQSVASFLPGHFAAYARVLHPFVHGGAPPVAPGTWRELAHRYGFDLCDAVQMEEFVRQGVPESQARIGSLPLAAIDALLVHLRPATTTPAACYFAVWEGFACLPVPPDLEPKLDLPNRRYHVFAGPLDAARTSFSDVPYHHQSPNLWWPADHAWCVATEVDHPWSFVGGPSSCIDALLADPLVDAERTSAADPW